MNQFLSTSGGRNVVAALLGVLAVGLIGILAGAAPEAIVFAAAIFGALIVIIVQLSTVVYVIWQSRGTPADVGATMEAEIETPQGQQELKQMSFSSLLTVAVVQELYVSLFKRDQPLWAFEFLGIGADEFIPKDYGWFNRYLEWMLMIGLGTFTGICAILIAYFVYKTTPPRALGMNAATLLCTVPSFFVGLLLFFAIGLFFTSVIRRMFILYSMRTDGSRIK